MERMDGGTKNMKRRKRNRAFGACELVERWGGTVSGVTGSKLKSGRCDVEKCTPLICPFGRVRLFRDQASEKQHRVQTRNPDDGV